jgi:hypothetical protein
VNHISFWDNETLKTGTKSPIYHDSSCSLGHHDDIRRNPKSLFTSDLFIQPGDNHKAVISDDLSENMINLYRAVGIFVSEQPVRRTTERLVKLNPRMVYPMYHSCLDGSVFPKYVEAIMKRFCLC